MFTTTCVVCGVTSPTEDYRTIFDDPRRCCPKCYAKQPRKVNPNTVYDKNGAPSEEYKECKRCSAYLKLGDYKKVVTCGDGDFILVCPKCGYQYN